MIHFRKQRELENAILVMGEALRSRYLLSFIPQARDPNPHRITVEVKQPGTKVYARAEYRATTQ